MADDPRRALPAVERVVESLDGLPRPVLVECARDAVDAARARVGGGARVDFDEVVADARARVTRVQSARLRRVVNATGVLLHTNLGRAPIGTDAVHDAAETAGSYSNLEYRLDSGTRGSRHEHAAALLAEACGASAGVVVNNNAAAVLGELVEIGGGFRVPEIMSESGCRLVEVGTTNRTRLADYQRALEADTALVLKVHASNYRMVGFVESTPVDQLVTLGVPVMVDAGSGLLDQTTPWLPHPPAWLRDEPGVRQAIDAGASLVTFSGDKLLGGPQAGIAVGDPDAVAALARHPLARAMRPDKLTLALLQHVASAYLAGDATAIPLWRMATAPIADLRVRAESLAEAVAGVKPIDTEAVAGGGSLPGLTIPSVGVAIESRHPDELHAQLRFRGVVARVEDGRLVCDLRSVLPDDDRALLDALRATCA